MYSKTQFRQIEKAEALQQIAGGLEVQDKTKLAAIIKALYYSAPELVRVVWGCGSFYAIPTKKGLEWAKRIAE